MAHVVFTVRINSDNEVVSIGSRRGNRSAGEPIREGSARAICVIKSALRAARGVGMLSGDTFEVIPHYIDAP